MSRLSCIQAEQPASWGAWERNMDPRQPSTHCRLPYAPPACALQCPPQGSPVWLVMLLQHGAPPPPPQHCAPSFTSHIVFVHTQKQKNKHHTHRKLHSARNQVNDIATTLNFQKKKKMAKQTLSTEKRGAQESFRRDMEAGVTERLVTLKALVTVGGTEGRM